MTQSHDDPRPTDTPETDTRETESDVREATDRVVGALFGVGRLWAAHGLDVGRSALRASASTLETTAELLGDLSQKIGRDDEAA